MVHLTEESLSELLDGSPVANAEEHLAGCPACQGELEALRRLRSELRDLPELQPPEGSWSRIAKQLPAGRRVRRWRRSGMIALQAVAAAAVFVLGVGLGRVFQPGVAVDDGARLERSAVQPTASLAEAMAEVRKRGAEYDVALRNLEQLARREGAPVPSLAQQRLASLEMLVEASRTALSVEPTDPVLNSYLFAAIEQRDAVMLEMTQSQESGSAVLWR